MFSLLSVIPFLVFVTHRQTEFLVQGLTLCGSQMFFDTVNDLIVFFCNLKAIVFKNLCEDMYTGFMYVYTNKSYLNTPDLGFEANVYFFQRKCMIMIIISIIL